jgi:hypothetical protein
MQFLHIVEISENKTKHGKLLDVQGEILIPKTEGGSRTGDTMPMKIDTCDHFQKN